MIDLQESRMGPGTDPALPGNNLEGLRDLLEHATEHGRPLCEVVEIGAYLGVSSSLIAQWCERLDVVDCWGDVPGYTDCDWVEPDWPAIEAECRSRLNPLKPSGVGIYKATSLEAVAWWGDASLDLVYIDGDHSQAACGADMDHWWPKIRPGGWLAGHDFCLPGVNAAVLDRFVPADVTTFSDTSWLCRKPQVVEPPCEIRESRTGDEALSDEEVIRRFHEIAYERWYPLQVKWMGTHAIKSPLDLWQYQEIMCEVKPNLVIETGTFAGGSALFLANMCDLLGCGVVVSIDINRSPDDAPWPKHPRLAYVHGDSSTPEVRDEALSTARAEGDTVMVILDSDHSKAHVAKEIALYAPLVSVGSYLIVEDTNVNGNPVLPDFGPGPAEAVDEFLASPAGAGFEVDTGRERFLFTQCPGGYLKRIS